MASVKKDAPGPQGQKAAEPFDYAKYLDGTGINPAEIIVWEGLTPIYAAKQALEEGWEPALAWIMGTEVLKTLRPGEDNEYTPLMVRGVLERPNHAISGPKADRKIVDLAKGDQILFPVGASLRVFKKLERACIDPEQVFLLFLRVTHTAPSQHPQDTFMWEVADTGQRKKREGIFTLPGNEVVLLDGTIRQLSGHTANGTAFNPQTGEVQGSQARS